jgi:hypothetical protein
MGALQMWLAIVAQLLTAATALGLLWRDCSELKKRHRYLPIGLFVWGLAQLCTTTNGAAPRFAVFEAWAPRISTP